MIQFTRCNCTVICMQIVHNIIPFDHYFHPYFTNIWE